MNLFVPMSVCLCLSVCLLYELYEPVCDCLCVLCMCLLDELCVYERTFMCVCLCVCVIYMHLSLTKDSTLTHTEQHGKVPQAKRMGFYTEIFSRLLQEIKSLASNEIVL